MAAARYGASRAAEPPGALAARLRRLARAVERAAQGRGLAVAPVFALAPLLAACGGGGGDDAPPAPPPPPPPPPPPDPTIRLGLDRPDLDNAGASEPLAVVGGGEPNTVRTGSGADNVRTQGGNDVILSGAGDDEVDAGAGSDIVNAGPGNDTVAAGAGDDVVVYVGSNARGAAAYRAYAESDLADVRGSGIDLSGAVSLEALRDRAGNDGAADRFDGGGGADTLVVFGTADLSGAELANIERIVIASDATFGAGQLANVESIRAGEGAVLRLAGSGAVDLSRLRLGADAGAEGVPPHIEVGAEVTLLAPDAGALAGIRLLSGAGRVAVAADDDNAFAGIVLAEGLRVAIGAGDPDNVRERTVSRGSVDFGGVADAAGNDAPVAMGDGAIAVSEGAARILAAADVAAVDPDADDGPAQLTWRVTAAPEHGRIALAAAPGAAIAIFTQAQLAAGEIAYVHGGGEGPSDRFELRVEDDGEPPLMAAAATVTVAVAAVDDAPSAVTLSETTPALAENADTSAARKVAVAAVTDVDGGPRDLELAGADAALFELFELSGDRVELRLKAGAELDFSANPALDVTVRAAANPEAAAALRIAISPVNAVRGNDENNRLDGEAGIDLLFGAGGNDELRGMGGDDALDGGAGDDELTGGPGADVFVYRFDSANGGLSDGWTGAGGWDLVLDFNPAQGDKLRFIDANTGANRIDTLAEFKAAFDLERYPALARTALDRDRGDAEYIDIRFGAPSRPDRGEGGASGQHKLHVYPSAPIPSALFDSDSGEFDDVDAFIAALGGAGALEFG